MKRWGYLKIAVALSVLHLAAALGSFVVGFSIGMKRWDVGKAGLLESAANGLAEVLLQPGLRLLKFGMSGGLEWAIIFGNSVLWGAVGALVVLGIRRAVKGKAAY